MTAPCFRFRLQQYNRHLKSGGNDYFLLAFSSRFSDIAREKLVELQFRRGRELQQRPGQAELKFTVNFNITYYTSHILKKHFFIFFLRKKFPQGWNI